MQQMTENTDVEIFDRFISLAKETFALGHYDVSYHALAAAYHWAQDTASLEWLSTVEALANEQMAWIDKNAAHYHHSTEAAALRGHDALLKTLAMMAHTKKSTFHLAAHSHPANLPQ